MNEKPRIATRSLCECSQVRGQVRESRSFDCAPFGRFAQDDIKNKNSSLLFCSGSDQGFGQNAGIGLPQFSLRSSHVGFSRLMSSIFFALIQPFSCFSRAIAALGVV